jgi:hypothetical protein
MIASLIIWFTVMHPVTFDARFGTMPSSIDLQTYRAAVKAAARPSFCMWTYVDCGVS